jgi:hypothetical protein
VTTRTSSREPRRATDALPADFAPPRFADPRRLGSLIGLAGSVVFVFSYSPALGSFVAAVAQALVCGLVAVSLWWMFGSPRWLGRFIPPRRRDIAVFLGCVALELLALRLTIPRLEDAGHAGLAPAVIALVVGVHFIPFAWAFSERMFYFLGGALAALGTAGLGLGWALGDAWANGAAVLSGLAMSGLLASYALGRWAD